MTNHAPSCLCKELKMELSHLNGNVLLALFVLLSIRQVKSVGKWGLSSGKEAVFSAYKSQFINQTTRRQRNWW